MLFTMIVSDAFTMCRLVKGRLQETVIQKAKVHTYAHVFLSYELTLHAAVIPDSPLLIPDKELSGR